MDSDCGIFILLSAGLILQLAGITPPEAWFTSNDRQTGQRAGDLFGGIEIMRISPDRNQRPCMKIAQPTTESSQVQKETESKAESKRKKYTPQFEVHTVDQS
jgi:hypothetical protein